MDPTTDKAIFVGPTTDVADQKTERCQLKTDGSPLLQIESKITWIR